MNKEKLLETAKPILFNTEMVRAIKDGRKTQFRIAIENIREDNLYDDYLKKFIDVHSEYKKGDAIQIYDETDSLYTLTNPSADTLMNFTYYCKNTFLDNHKKICDGIITDVRVERLQDITCEDIQAEGISMSTFGGFANSYDEACEFIRGDFIKLWNSIAKDGYKWEDNPYVFVYEFEVIK